MGRCTWLWLRLLMVALGTACGNASSGQGPGTGTGGVAGAATGGVAGSSGTTGGAVVATSGGQGAASGGGGTTAAGGSGGTTTAGGSGGTTAGGSGGATAGDAGLNAGAGGAAVAELCPEARTPRLAAGTVLEIPFILMLEGKPLRFAEANPVAGERTLTPLDLRFYVSEVALLREGAEPLPVEVVTPTGAVAPYGIYFFNADDAASTTLRVLAPAGNYTGITFLWGLAQACNTRRPELNTVPLSATSQMTWPHAGYLFLRYQGRSTVPAQGSGGAGGAGGGGGAGSVGAGGAGGAGGSAGVGGGPSEPVPLFPPVIHMGGSLAEPLAPAVRVDGALSVSASGAFSKSMRVALDEIFKGALSDVDLTGFVGPPGEEVLLGERLRRSMPTLRVFSFGP